MKKNFFFLIVLIIVVLTSCSKDDDQNVSTSDTTTQQNSDAVSVSLGTYFTLSKDLFAFVTPTITYTDVDGEHEVEISPDMCTESSFTDKGILYSHYRRDWDIAANLVPGEEYNVTLSFCPKEGSVVNLDKRYYFLNGFNINNYKYIYNGFHQGTIININIDIKISIVLSQEEKDKEDGLLGGQYVEEYIKQLCASPQNIKVKLEKNGHLIIDDKQY